MIGLDANKTRAVFDIAEHREWHRAEPCGSWLVDNLLIEASGGNPESPCEISRGPHVAFYPTEGALSAGEMVQVPVTDRASFRFAYQFARTWIRLTYGPALRAAGGPA